MSKLFNFLWMLFCAHHLAEASIESLDKSGIETPSISFCTFKDYTCFPENVNIKFFKVYQKVKDKISYKGWKNKCIVNEISNSVALKCYRWPESKTFIFNNSNSLCNNSVCKVTKATCCYNLNITSVNINGDVTYKTKCSSDPTLCCYCNDESLELEDNKVVTKEKKSETRVDWSGVKMTNVSSNNNFRERKVKLGEKVSMSNRRIQNNGRSKSNLPPLIRSINPESRDEAGKQMIRLDPEFFRSIRDRHLKEPRVIMKRSSITNELRPRKSFNYFDQIATNGGTEGGGNRNSMNSDSFRDIVGILSEQKQKLSDGKTINSLENIQGKTRLRHRHGKRRKGNF